MPFQTFVDPQRLPEHLAGGALAIGNFDGVHRGHRAVIEAAQALARGRPALAVTFEPHPRQVLRPERPLFRLTSPEAKAELFERLGLAGMVSLTFDSGLAATSAEAFLNEIVLGRLGAHVVAVGYDFHFGRGREGTPQMLVERGAAAGLTTAVVEAENEGGVPVSSSAIRAALEEGDVALANRLLGHEWFVLAEVVHGEKRGRTLGYPTANMRLDPTCGLRHGIYAVRAVVDGVARPAVASFGRRPTFDNGAPLLETFIFDYGGDLYGRTIEIRFVGWIRGEERFDSLETLVARMDEDSRQARALTAG